MDIKIKDEKLLALIDDDFQASLDNAEELSSLRTKDFDTYRGAPYAPDKRREAEGWSTTVNTVVANTVNWTLPGLVEIFSDDFFRFRIEDQDFAEDLKKYIRKIWFRMQDGEKKNDSFIFDCLTCQTGGFFKIYYDRRTSIQTLELEQAPVDAVNAQIEAGAEIVSGERVTESIDGMTLEYWKDLKMSREVVEYEGPVIEVPAPDEIGYSPEAKSIDDARLSWCRSVRDLDYVKRMIDAGEFKKDSLKKAKEAAVDVSAEETRQERDNKYFLDGLSTPEDNGMDMFQSSEKELEAANSFYLYEVYTKMDIDGDGLLENVIIWMSGNVVFGVKENPYKRPPLRRGLPFKIPHQYLQDSFPNMLSDEQKRITTFDRLASDAGAKATYQNIATNDDTLFKQLKNRGPNSVFKTGRGAEIQDITPNEPNQFILKMKEAAQGDVENRSGVTRYNQGLDANSLNKTLGGINMIMSASQQRQKLYARRIGWAFRDVIADFIFILDKWPTEEYQAILQEHGIAPGTVKAENIQIDVGVSFQEKFAMAQQLDGLIQFGMQAGLQLGMEPANIFNALRKKYELLGVRTEGMIPDEDELRRKQQQQQATGVPPEAQASAGGSGMSAERGVDNGIGAAPQEFSG